MTHTRDGRGEPTQAEADLRALLDLLAGSDLVELEVERDGLRVCIRRDPTLAARGWPPPPLADGDGTEVGATPQANGSCVVPSPLVGVFYAGVRVGDLVAPGQAVGTVEALRMRHAVECESPGVVEEVLVSDGHAVEYGQALLRLKIGPVS